MSKPKLQPYEPIIKNSVIQKSLEQVRKKIDNLQNENKKLSDQNKYLSKEIESWRTTCHKLIQKIERLQK
jgi:predicted RNase H-like nuclease (RuvC/YqgF family)